MLLLDAAGRGGGDDGIDPILLRIAALLNITTPAAAPTRSPFARHASSGGGSGGAGGSGGEGENEEAYDISASDVTVVTRRTKGTPDAHTFKATFLPPADSSAFAPAADA